jgi:hypothetical protein
MEMNERGQMILLFAAAVVVVILSLSHVYAQNIIAGIESSRFMLAFPKEEIRNLCELSQQNPSQEVVNEMKILCAKNGWVCNVGLGGKVEFKNVEVDYRAEDCRR